jgi:hypothetical protein
VAGPAAREWSRLTIRIETKTYRELERFCAQLGDKDLTPAMLVRVGIEYTMQHPEAVLEAIEETRAHQRDVLRRLAKIGKRGSTQEKGGDTPPMAQSA